MKKVNLNKFIEILKKYPHIYGNTTCGCVDTGLDNNKLTIYDFCNLSHEQISFLYREYISLKRKNLFCEGGIKTDGQRMETFIDIRLKSYASKRGVNEPLITNSAPSIEINLGTGKEHLTLPYKKTHKRDS